MIREICTRIASFRYDSRSQNRYPGTVKVEMADGCRVEYRRTIRMPAPVIWDRMDHSDTLYIGYRHKKTPGWVTGPDRETQQ